MPTDQRPHHVFDFSYEGVNLRILHPDVELPYDVMPPRHPRSDGQPPFADDPVVTRCLPTGTICDPRIFDLTRCDPAGITWLYCGLHLEVPELIELVRRMAAGAGEMPNVAIYADTEQKFRDFEKLGRELGGQPHS